MSKPDNDARLSSGINGAIWDITAFEIVVKNTDLNKYTSHWSNCVYLDVGNRQLVQIFILKGTD